MNSHPINNLLTLASVYLVKFCNFYPHLSLGTVFPVLKLTQIFCINMNISFLENWQFLNHKLAPSLLLTYQGLQNNLTIWQNMKVEFKNFNLTTLEWSDRNLGVHPELIFNNQYFIYFMNWKKLGSSVRATLTNAIFQFSLCELGKKLSKPTTHIQTSSFWI